MAKMYELVLLVVVAVLTVYPLVFLGQQDQLWLKSWYSSFGSVLQTIIYSLARLTSYPYIADLQHAASTSSNNVSAFLVVTLGELTGGLMQGFLFECVSGEREVCMFSLQAFTPDAMRQQ